jgi:hypothetical protein
VPAYIDFLKLAFGAVEDARHLGPGGRVMHAQVRIGNAVIELGDPDPAESQPRTFYLYVDDADALYHRAVAAGATSLAPPADMFLPRPCGQRPGFNRHGLVHRATSRVGGGRLSPISALSAISAFSACNVRPPRGTSG